MKKMTGTPLKGRQCDKGQNNMLCDNLSQNTTSIPTLNNANNATISSPPIHSPLNLQNSETTESNSTGQHSPALPEPSTSSPYRSDSLGTKSQNNRLCTWCRVNENPKPRFLNLIQNKDDPGKSIIIVQESFFIKEPLYSIELKDVNSIDRDENVFSTTNGSIENATQANVAHMNSSPGSEKPYSQEESIYCQANDSKFKLDVADSTTIPFNETENSESLPSTKKSVYSLKISAGAKSVQIQFDSARLREKWFIEIGKLMIAVSELRLKFEISKIRNLYQSIPFEYEDINITSTVDKSDSHEYQGKNTASSNRANNSNRNSFSFSSIKENCLNFFNTLRATPVPLSDQPSIPPPPIPVQQPRVNHWKIDYSSLKLQQMLAEGSFGVVYRGELYSKEVAIKKLKLRDNVISSQLIDDLLKEAEVLAALRHPNVLLFMGVTDPPEICMVTEYLEQGNVLQVLRKQLLNDLQLNSILLDICYGVHYLHKQKVLHLDLKPANILMSKNGILAKVADFGISRMVQNENDKIRDESQEGTLLYMSPELAFDRTMSIASDVYSFGVVLYEILFLREHPSLLQNSNGFENEDLIALGFDLVREYWENEPPPHCPPWWNPVFADICRNCLYEDPNQRISFPDIITKLISIKDENILNPWFLFEYSAKEIMNLTKDIEFAKKLSPSFKTMEVIQFCLLEFRSPTIHYNALCSLIHLSCIQPDQQQYLLSRAIQALYEIKDRSIEFFESVGDFRYWNLMLDCKNLTTAEKKNVLQHILHLCSNVKIRTRFVQEGAIGLIAHKLASLRKFKRTPLPFTFARESASSMFRADYFDPSLYSEATDLLTCLCKDQNITRDRLENEGVIPTLVSLSNVELREHFSTNIAFNALEALADLLVRFPSISTSCYTYHINPKLIAAREYLKAISKFQQIISKDRRALNLLASSKFGKHSESEKDLRKFLSHTSPLPKATLAALRQQYRRQKFNRNSMFQTKEQSNMESNLTRLLEEKTDYFELIQNENTPRIEDSEREDIYIKFWENIQSVFDGNELSPAAIEKIVTKEYLQKRKIKTDVGIQFIKGLVQQIDTPSLVIEGLYVGSEWNAASNRTLRELGVTNILNVATKSPCYFEKEFTYHHITENTDSMLSCFHECCRLIDSCLQSGGKMLIHSSLGTNRSPAYCIAYLMKLQRLDLREVYKYLKTRRSIFNIDSRYIRQLMLWQSYLRANHSENNHEVEC